MAARDNAEEGATTYRHYVAAFRVCCGHAGYERADALASYQRGLPWFASAQRNGHVSDPLKKHLFRGWLTLHAMRALPVEREPDLAIGASMWLPVQAYYACHGVGLAALYALNCSMPDDSRLKHRGFLRTISDKIVRADLVAPPFAAGCSGDCVAGTHSFLNTAVSVEQVRTLSNLSRPSSQGRAEVLVAKCLKTTRGKVINDLYAKNRGRKGKRLSQESKRTILNGIHTTSCFDFLYRMRANSNYDDAEMFLFGQDREVALAHSADVIWLANAVCLQLESVIRHKVGDRAFAVLQREFSTAITQRCGA